MKFHPVIGYNSWCGPAALAIVLGLTTDEAARRIREKSGQKMVKSSKPTHILSVLKDAGWKVIHMPPYIKSIKNLPRESKHYSSGMYLCATSTHFLVLAKKESFGGSTWTFADNCYKTPTPFAKTNQTKRIEHLWYLVPPPIIDLETNSL